jgi:GxxExxY protein
MDINEIMDIAKYVYEELGQGHTEKVYQRGVQAVLNHRRIFHTIEAPIPISILGQVIGSGRCDILVGQYALELKANASAPSRATGQLHKYLTGLNARKDPPLYHGIVINFNQRGQGVEFLEVVAIPTPVTPKKKPPVAPVGTRTLVAEFIELHLKSVSNADSLVPVSEMKDSFERFLQAPMDMSLPEFRTKLGSMLRKTQLSGEGRGRILAYGSRNAKLPGLILLA